MPENAPAAAARPLGPISRARASLEAIRTLLRLREDRGTPTVDDLAALREWPGWGPLAPALSENRSGSWAEIGEELQRLLPPRDYRQAEQGTSTAYYTPDVIVQECWTALRDLNFSGGSILEPGCGAGSFISQTPDGMPVQWYGVERDPTTAGIAALLHPDAVITNARLQDAGLQTNSVDAVLGNVPYGNFPVHDKTAPKAVTESIHNYFIWRSVQALRPGGVAILLTSRYTMDAVDEEGRRAIARHADLLGAVRLPTGALAEGGTEVVADLLVLRRRDTNGPMDTSWMESSEIPEVPGQFANNYFLDHPEHVLGTFQEGRARQYGITLAVKPPEGQDLATALGTALGSITAAAREAGRDWRVAVGAQPFTADALPFPVREDGRQEGSFHLVDGRPHEVVDGELVAVERAGKELPKLIALRDATVKLIEAETNHDTPDVQLDPLRAEVNRLYDAYVQKHGPINRYTLAEGQVDEETGEKAISRRYPRLGGFRRDPDIVAVLALEDFNDETQTADKAPLLTRRVNRRIERPTSAQSPEEALSLCLNFKNKIDVPTIAQLLGIEEEQVPGALGELVFPDPDNGELMTRGAYLSGPVVDKLERAEFLLSQGRDDLQRHVDALREVQPEPLSPEDIKAKLGAPWIPVDDVKAFAEELLGVGVDILHVPRTATWSVDQPMTMPEAATSEWGTSRVNAFELLDLALNGQAPKVYDTFLNPDGGSRRVRNDKETMLAESKLMALTRRFASWVWEDPDRADRLAADYNRIFNATVLPKHDGSHLTVDGIDPDFKPYTHQWDFVQRVLSAEEGSLCPYPVGAGKTATMFMTAAKLKQLGLVSKPMIIVPNHLLEQIARDGKKLFPNARILMAGKKDLADARSRMLFAARCATGDWDTIVMTHNSFGRLGVHPVTEATYLEELANEYRIALSTLDTDDRKDRRIKEIAKMVDRFDARASDLRSKATDAGVTYENLGIDFLQVDEAHKFKNLALPATTEGMSLGKPSKRATDLDLKLILTRERTGRDNVTALYSGTFIDNSVREMYVFQHYAMPKRLEKLGLGSPDAWAANFIHFESRPEVGVDGVSFRLKRRPVEYTNADEALALFAEVAELRPPEEFKIERPRRVDRFVEIDATPNLVRYVGSISHRIDQIQTGRVKPFEDNMLNVITDGRKAALDLELVGMLPDGPGKAGAIVQNVLEIHERTKDLKLPGDPDDVSGGLQLIFCDLGTPSKKRGSQVYGKIRKGLVEGMPELGLPGIPRERIRFIHDYNSDLAKEQLFSDARAGKVSVLFMSSEKGGTGVNVQTRGVALHHADPPHKPAEWEQREGRLHRPGNRLIDLDMEVEFLRYIALNSFDSYMFQQLERKQRPIVQIMSGRKVGRVIQEIDPVGAGFGQAKAIATGNPMLMELADVNGELTMLLNEADGHRQAQARMKRKTEVLTDEIREAEQTLPGMRAMADAITAAGDDDTWRTADGRVIDPDDVAGVLAQTAQASKPTLDLDAGYRWRGMSVGFTWHRGRQFGTVAYESYAHLVAGGHQVEVRLNLSWFGKGQSWRITKALSEAAEAAVNAPAEIERKTAKQRAALEDTRSHIGRPFDKHVELEAVRQRKAALEDQISGAAVDTGRESGSGPQFDPGAAAGEDEMSLADMAMHDATAMAGMLGGTAVVVSEGQIIGGARVIDRTDVDLRTPDLADLGQYQEALRALIEAAASDEGLTARARAAGADYGASDFRAAVAEWAQDWALERANRPEDRPAWLRDWLEPESADARQMLIGEAAWIVWEQARATEPGQAPTVPQDTPTPEFEPEPVPAAEESAAPPAPPQPGPQEPVPATTPEAAPQEPVNGTANAAPAEAETPSGTDGQTPLQDLVDTFGERVVVGHIGVPQPARAHQIAGWAIMVVLSESQVRGLVSAIGADRQPPRDSRHLPGELVREWIAEQQQAPTTAFYASSSVLPPAVRANGDVHLSTRADGLTIEQGDVTTTIRWEELPAWIDAAVAHDTSTRSAPWHYGSLDAEIHSRRFEPRSRDRAMKALDVALRWAPPPTDEQLAQARARYAPPAAPAATANPPAPEDAPAEKSTPQEPAQLPENAAPVPGAEGYHYIEEGRTVRLYTEAGDEVGTAKWSHSKYRYLGDVQGDTVRGTEDGATVAKRMANHHAVVYGDRVHRPTVDGQGRDPVWILHNGSDTLVFGVSPEDDTAKAAMWTGGGFKQSRKVGGWYLPRTWKEPTRRQRVDDAVRVLAAAGRTVTVHTSRAERQEPPQRPARLPELVVTAPDLDEVPQLFDAEPFTAQDGLVDVQALETAYARWGRHPTVRAYLQQDSDARPNGFGTPDNPIAELHIAYHRARLALREPVPGGPQEIVRRVYGVAAWCQELEVVVDDDLLDPLQDVYKAAHLLAARAQATVALATERPSANNAPEPAPKREAPPAAQQEPGGPDPAAATEEQVQQSPEPAPGLADAEQQTTKTDPTAQQTPPKPDPAPSATPGTSGTRSAPAGDGEKAEGAVPRDAEQLPAADGYYFTGDENGTVHLYTASEGLVGTARWSSIQDRYVADVQGETFPGAEDAATTAKHMASYHAVVHGGDVRQPESEAQKPQGLVVDDAFAVLYTASLGRVGAHQTSQGAWDTSTLPIGYEADAVHGPFADPELVTRLEAEGLVEYGPLMILRTTPAGRERITALTPDRENSAQLPAVGDRVLLLEQAEVGIVCERRTTGGSRWIDVVRASEKSPRSLPVSPAYLTLLEPAAVTPEEAAELYRESAMKDLAETALDEDRVTQWAQANDQDTFTRRFTSWLLETVVDQWAQVPPDQHPQWVTELFQTTPGAEAARADFCARTAQRVYERTPGANSPMTPPTEPPPGDSPADHVDKAAPPASLPDPQAPGPAAAATGGESAPSNHEQLPAREPEVPEVSRATPEGTVAVPGADGYRYVTERNASRTIYLYTDDEDLVGTARRAHARARYVADVQGDTVPGTTQTLTTVQLMAEHHAVVHGTQVHRPDGDAQGRDPVWVFHSASDTLVHGVEPDDRTALAALRAARFSEAHTIGAWHLLDLHTGTTRQDCVDTFVRTMAAAGRPVEVHADRAARARTAAPDTLPELTVAAPNLDQVPQMEDAPPYADNADARQDIDQLSAAWQRWSEQPLVAAYHEQDRQARPDGKGPARNPVTELRLAHERAEQALENPGLAGRDEIVRRIYEVAAWCQALEPAVPDELLSPLRDMQRTALVLTSRAQATAAAGGTAETGSDTETDQQGDDTELNTTPPQSADADTTQLAEYGRRELTGAAGIRYWIYGSGRPGAPETTRFHVNRQTRSYSFSQPVFSGSRQECLDYIESEAAVRSAAEAQDRDSEQQVAAARAWLRERGLEVRTGSDEPVSTPPKGEPVSATEPAPAQPETGGVSAPGDGPEQVGLFEFEDPGQRTGEETAGAQTEALQAERADGPAVAAGPELERGTGQGGPAARPAFAMGDKVYLDGLAYTVSEVSEDGTTLRAPGGIELAAQEVTHARDMPPVTSEKLTDGWWRIAYRDRSYTAVSLPDELTRGRLSTLSTVITDASGELVGRDFGVPPDSRIIWAYHHPGVLHPDVTSWWQVGGNRPPLPEYSTEERAFVAAGPPGTPPLPRPEPAQAKVDEQTTPSENHGPDVPSAPSSEPPNGAAPLDQPKLGVVLLDVDVPPLGPAEPYDTDEEVQADIGRLGEAFARWDALPLVQRYHEADRQQRPDGTGTPANPVAQLAAAYRDAEQSLRDGPAGSPDDLVRQVHTVAVWSGALEPVVDEDLRGPLGEVREAAALLATRSRATVEAFKAELAVLSAKPVEESPAADTAPDGQGSVPVDHEREAPADTAAPGAGGPAADTGPAEPPASAQTANAPETGSVTDEGSAPDLQEAQEEPAATTTSENTHKPSPDPQKPAAAISEKGMHEARREAAFLEQDRPRPADGDQQTSEPGTAAAPPEPDPAPAPTPTSEAAPSDETARDASEEPNMTTPPTPQTDAPAPDEQITEEPPAPQRYVDTVTLAGDPGYRLRMSGLDGQPVDSGDVLRGDLVIATLHPGPEGGWFAQLADDRLPQDVTYVVDAPHDAADLAAVMHSALTGVPYGPAAGAAVGDETRQRVDVLRAALRDGAVWHRGVLADATARAYPDLEQNARFQALVGPLDGLAAAVSDAHGSQRMMQHLADVQGAASAWGSALPDDPGHPERRQLAFPLARLLYEARKMQDQVQATLAAVQTEREAARAEEAAAAVALSQSYLADYRAGRPPRDEAAATAYREWQQLDAEDRQEALDARSHEGEHRSTWADETPPAVPDTGPRPEDAESRSPEVPDSQSANPARREATVGATTDAPAPEDVETAAAPGGDRPAPKDAVEAVRQALEDALRAADQPETAASEIGGLPLWTGPEASPGNVAATEPSTAMDVRAEFRAVLDAWDDHVPSAHGTAQDLVADLDADLAALQRAFAEAVPQPAPAEASTAAPVPQQAEAVNSTLQQADTHADALQDLPEWQKIQTVRGAVGHLARVLRERAGEYFERLMGDTRVGEFFRKISINACEKIAGWAQAGADRLRHRGEEKGTDTAAADALGDVADASSAYSSPGGPLPGTTSTTVDIPEMRKLGAALARPLPGARDGRGTSVSTAAARGKSTTRGTAKKAGGPGKRKAGGSAEQAGHLRRGGADPQQQNAKSSQR
ncbi:hypothetical protein ACF1G1_26095 [Streptomyces albidoflavus]